MPQDWKKSVEKEDEKRKKQAAAAASAAAKNKYEQGAKDVIENRELFKEDKSKKGESTGLEYEPRVTRRQERRWSKLLPGMENEPRVTPRQIRKWGKK
jgi:hypothetical protein